MGTSYNIPLDANEAIRVALAEALDETNDAIGAVSKASASIAGCDTVFDADGDNTAQVGKAAAGSLYSLTVANSNAADAWVQFFDVAAGSVTVGTTTPKLSFPAPKGDGTSSGAVSLVFTPPIRFGTAITYACTTTATGNGDPTTGLVVNLGIK